MADASTSRRGFVHVTATGLLVAGISAPQSLDADKDKEKEKKEKEKKQKERKKRGEGIEEE